MDDGLEELLEVRDRTLPDDKLLTLTVAVPARIDRYQAASLALVRELDARRLSASHGAKSTAQLLRDQTRMATATTRRLVTRAADLDTAPAVLADAVLAGEVRLDQAEVVMRTVKRLGGQVGTATVNEAAALLVESCRVLEPALLEPVGKYILRTAAPTSPTRWNGGSSNGPRRSPTGTGTGTSPSPRTAWSAAG